VDPQYILALTTGVLGGFGHCIGMCGPLVASQALSAHSPAARSSLQTVIPHLLYNLGRIVTYGLIGAIMGLSGSFVNVAARIMGVQNIVVMIAGMVMILMGISIIGYRKATGWIESHNSSVLKAARTILASNSPFRPATLGLVMGLLPCGMSYTIFIAAAGTGSPYSGMLVAMLFGLGTMPALLLFGTVVSSLSARFRGRIYQAGGVLVVMMGLYFLMKGIRLYAGL
jgi:uncharacterized protein